MNGITKRFPRGKVIKKLSFDFDGVPLEVTKFHPWKSRGCTVLTGDPSEKIEYHSEELHQSCDSLLAIIIHWIAFKTLGNNNGSLAEGVCRALCINSENKQ